MIEVRTHTLIVSMMANASTTAAFRGGKVLPDAATAWSAGSPPPLITCRRLFPAGFNPVVPILLVLLVLLGPIVAFARAFVHWKFRRRITAIVYGGSCRRHHVYLLWRYFVFTPLFLNYFLAICAIYTMLRYLDVNGKNK